MDKAHHASKLKGLIILLLGCFIGVAFYAGLSPLAHIVPWSWEKGLGSKIDYDLADKCIGNPKSQQIMDKLVKRIYPVLPQDKNFSVDVKIEKSIDVNAYAALGGEITVYSALLEQAKSPEELAGVLAHEIEHVRHRHIMEGVITRMFTAQGLSLIFSGSPSVADWTGYFLSMNFTKSQEAQADKSALRRLQMAHVDNSGFKDFFDRMQKADSAFSFISDHPADSDRVEMAKKFPNNDVTPILTQDEWNILKMHCTK